MPENEDNNKHSPLFEEKVFPEEWIYLKQRRNHLNNNQGTTLPKPPPTLEEDAPTVQGLNCCLAPPIYVSIKFISLIPQKPTVDYGVVGLAMSGGGIRSSTFNLGIVQKLVEKDYFQFIDYMSTVSGGGYIGSCISTIFAGKNKDNEKDWKDSKRAFVKKWTTPNKREGNTRKNKFKKILNRLVYQGKDEKKDWTKSFFTGLKNLITSTQTTGSPQIPFKHKWGEPEHNAFRHLRNYASYLAPKGWTDMIRFPFLILKGIVINSIIIAPYIMAAAIITVLISGKDIYNAYLNTFTPQKIIEKKISKSLALIPDAKGILVDSNSNQTRLIGKKLTQFDIQEKTKEKIKSVALQDILEVVRIKLVKTIKIENLNEGLDKVLKDIRSSIQEKLKERESTLQGLPELITTAIKEKFEEKKIILKESPEHITTAVKEKLKKKVPSFQELPEHITTAIIKKFKEKKFALQDKDQASELITNIIKEKLNGKESSLQEIPEIISTVIKEKITNIKDENPENILEDQKNILKNIRTSINEELNEQIKILRNVQTIEFRKLHKKPKDPLQKIEITTCDYSNCQPNPNSQEIQFIGQPIDLSANQWTFLPPQKQTYYTISLGLAFLFILILYPFFQSVWPSNRETRKTTTKRLSLLLLLLIIAAFIESQPYVIYYYSASIYKLKNVSVIDNDLLSAAFGILSAILAAIFSGTGLSKKSGLIEKLKLYFIGFLGFASLWILYLALCRHILFKRHEWEWFGLLPKWLTSPEYDWNLLKLNGAEIVDTPPQLAGIVPSSYGISQDIIIYSIIAFAIFLYTRIFVDINKHSINRFYRDQLSKAFLFALSDDGKEVKACDSLYLSELGGNSKSHIAPYHLINTALNLPNSKNPDLIRGRNTDFFIFSKYFIGGEITDYYKTNEFEEQGIDPHIDLGSAMSISAAAATPNAGTTTIKPLVFIMAMLNIRLGYWLPNPTPNLGKEENNAKDIFSKAKNLLYKVINIFPNNFLRFVEGPSPKFLLWEMFGLIDEKDSHVNLSDGGHIENLGVYELLRRRCKYIIVGDGEADPDLKFEGLAILMRLSRIDMGIDININVEHLEKNEETGMSQGHWTIGTIRYGNGEEGKLLYVKLSITGDENRYVKEYRSRKEGADFPHQSTADQFFDETQFEVYRALGHHVASDLFPNKDTDDSEEFLDDKNWDVKKWFDYLSKKDEENRNTFKREREWYEKRSGS